MKVKNPVAVRMEEIPWLECPSGKVRVVSTTPDGEDLIAYVARVSSPNQEKEDKLGLLKYCISKGHWSVFEQADLTMEIICPLAISIQILRHRSACFQQFSQRYAAVGQLTTEFAYFPKELREQDTKNRQNSISWSQSDELALEIRGAVQEFYQHSMDLYNSLLANNVAKEIARFVLPEGVYTRLYMKNNIRNWIHYLKIRDEKGVVQWEHVEIARLMKEALRQHYPIISKLID